MQEKKFLRDDMRKIKLRLSNYDKRIASELVFLNFTKLKELNYAQNILLYYSLPDELQTSVFFEGITDKNIFLPKVNGNDLIILPYIKEELKQGAFSILEPQGTKTANPDDMDIIIVPGVAFDKQFNRLGRGKGFYDKLLSHNNSLKIGIGYDFQLLESIPSELHDIKMDIILTPSITLKQS